MFTVIKMLRSLYPPNILNNCHNDNGKAITSTGFAPHEFMLVPNYQHYTCEMLTNHLLHNLFRMLPKTHVKLMS